MQRRSKTIVRRQHLSSDCLDGDGEQWGVTSTVGTTLQQSVKHSAYSRCLQGKCQGESTEVADSLTTISIGDVLPKPVRLGRGMPHAVSNAGVPLVHSFDHGIGCQQRCQILASTWGAFKAISRDDKVTTESRYVVTYTLRYEKKSQHIWMTRCQQRSLWYSDRIK